VSHRAGWLPIRRSPTSLVFHSYTMHPLSETPRPAPTWCWWPGGGTGSRSPAARSRSSAGPRSPCRPTSPTRGSAGRRCRRRSGDSAAWTVAEMTGHRRDGCSRGSCPPAGGQGPGRGGPDLPGGVRHLRRRAPAGELLRRRGHGPDPMAGGPGRRAGRGGRRPPGGSNFAANWGSVGFFGPLTVAPGTGTRASPSACSTPPWACSMCGGPGTPGCSPSRRAPSTWACTRSTVSGRAFSPPS
jgi:hypothetical protein